MNSVSDGLSPMSKELDDASHENESLQKDKTELEDRLKKSRGESASLQQRLHAKGVVLEAANKQELALEKKVVMHDFNARISQIFD